MQLRIINSNSAGNSYILENDREALLIECGVAFSKIKQALGFDIRKVAGCIITHEHGDHAKAIREVMAAGINVYATEGTHHALGTSKSHRAIITFHGDQFKVGSFLCLAFRIDHDVAEPVGYLIYHPDCGKVLFLTDSKLCEFTFPGLNNIIIEANYCRDILKSRGISGDSPEFLNDRVLQSHMSIQTCRKTLAANDLSAVQRIVLIHLSDRNSDSARFKREVEEQTGKLVYIADPGLVIPFDKNPF